MYKIPRDSNIARRWLDACGYENFQISPSTASFKVCREHFNTNDFDGTTTLRPDAVPSLFSTHSRSLMNKQSINDLNLSSSSLTSVPSSKRMRTDMASIRAKQTTPTNNNSFNNKRGPAAYRSNSTNYSYQRQQINVPTHHILNNEQHQSQQQIHSPSSVRDSLDDSFKQNTHDSKQITDIDLNMNCVDEPLSETQMAHCPVKVSSLARFSFANK